MSVLTSMAEKLKGLPTVMKRVRGAIEACRREGKALKSMTTATVPASGSCAVQLVLKDQDSSTLTSPLSGLLYLSEVGTGLTHDLADTTLAVLTNGALTNIGGAGPSLFTTTAAGLLGVTITAATDSYWLVLVQPDGTMLISDECVVNA